MVLSSAVCWLADQCRETVVGRAWIVVGTRPLRLSVTRHGMLVSVQAGGMCEPGGG